MSRLAKFYPSVFMLSACLAALPVMVGASDKTGHYGIGKTATADEIAGWDIDIRPDGKGLPAGSGSVEDGEMMYEEKCASCHGSFGEGVGRYPVLSGGEGTLTEDRPDKTVGSYWPYATTVFDYVRRAMPLQSPGILSNDEVYAVTAYILHINGIVDEEASMNATTLPAVKMPNREGFTWAFDP